MSETDRILLAIEQQMLDADAAYDETFFDKHCTADFVAMGNYGVVDRAQVLQMYANGSGSRDRRNRIQDPRVRLLGDGGALVTYTLNSVTGAETSSWYASTAYRREDGEWRVAAIHQTPV
jgi:hypothetical protein